MTREATVCPQCGAPLPASERPLDEVTCPYCRTVSRRAATTRELVRATVRDVLREDTNRNGVPDVLEPPRADQPRPARAVLVMAVAGAFVVVGALLAAAMLTGSATQHSVQRPMPRPAPVGSTPVAPSAPVVTAPRPEQRPRSTARAGAVRALALDEAGDVVTLLDGSVVKADPRTLEQKWSTAVGASGSTAMLIPRGRRLALATGDAIFFLDSATGALLKRWAYKNGGILEGACASGSDEVMVNVLGAGVMFFDAKAAEKVDWASHCRLKEPIGCPADQLCRWQSTSLSGASCRYAVTVGATTFHSCELDDGKGTHELIATGKVSWHAPGAAEDYFGVVSNVLIGATSSQLIALDPVTGAQRWARTGRMGRSAIAAGGVLFAGVEDQLVALDVQTGAPLATLHTP